MENDRPSSTAVLVAKGIAAVYKSPSLSYLVPNEAGEFVCLMLTQESKQSASYVRLLNHGWFRKVAFAIQGLITPGIFVHFALRKRSIEEATRRHIAEGVRQVVVLGAGLDTLTVRLAPQFPNVKFVEVDHPASQAAKRELLGPHLTSTSNLVLVASDLSIDGDRFKKSLDPDLETVYIAEGLLMYLMEEKVKDLLSMLSGSHVIFTAMSLNQEGVPSFEKTSKSVRWWLRFRREPFLWGIPPEDVQKFLLGLSFDLVNTTGEKDLRALYLDKDSSSIRVAAGEWIYLAKSL